MIKNIIFDFDGVLVDSEMLVAQSFCLYLCERNIQFTENDFSQFAGKKTVNVISELSAKFNIDNEQAFFNDIMQIGYFCNATNWKNQKSYSERKGCFRITESKT